MGLLGASFSSVRKSILDRFNRVNQLGLGFTEDNTQWDIIRPGFNIVDQKAQGTNADYPMAVVPFAGDVSISLAGISQGSSAALWVSDANNWWAVGIDQEPITCNCQTGTECAPGAFVDETCNETAIPIACLAYNASYNQASAWTLPPGQPLTYARNSAVCNATAWNAGYCVAFVNSTCATRTGGNCIAFDTICNSWNSNNVSSWNSRNCAAFGPTSCLGYTGGNCGAFNATGCIAYSGGNCAANNSSNCRAYTGGNCASSSCASSSCSSYRCNRYSRGRCVSSSCSGYRCNSYRCNRYNARNCSAYNSTNCARWNSSSCIRYGGGNCARYNATSCVVYGGGGCTRWNASNAASWNSRNCAQYSQGGCLAFNAYVCNAYNSAFCAERVGNTSSCTTWTAGTTYVATWTQRFNVESAWTTKYASANAAVSSANCADIRAAYNKCCTDASPADCGSTRSTWNASYCSQFRTFEFGCQTCYPQYIRLLQSSGGIVSEIFAWTVNTVIQSLRVKTKGEELTISAYSDTNLTTQIGSDIVYTPTGITVHPSYGITIQPSTQDQGYSFDSFEIERN